MRIRIFWRNVRLRIFRSSAWTLRRTIFKFGSKYSVTISRRDFWILPSYSLLPGRRYCNLGLPCYICTLPPPLLQLSQLWYSKASNVLQIAFLDWIFYGDDLMKDSLNKLCNVTCNPTIDSLTITNLTNSMAANIVTCFASI